MSKRREPTGPSEQPPRTANEAAPAAAPAVSASQRSDRVPPTLKPQINEWLSDAMQSPARAVHLFRELALVTVERLAAEGRTPRDGAFELVRAAALGQAEQSIRHVLAFAESPLERLFLGALLFHSTVCSPFLVVVTPPIDVAAQREELRSAEELCRQCQTELHLPGWPAREVLATWLRYKMQAAAPLRALPPAARDARIRETADRLSAYLIRYRLAQGRWAFHIAPQCVLPGVSVGGHGVRADFHVWSLRDPDFKLLIECDGFALHADRRTFTSDRQRDRALRAEGYDVLRFSGAEINRDPLGAGSQVARELAERHAQYAGEIERDAVAAGPGKPPRPAKLPLAKGGKRPARPGPARPRTGTPDACTRKGLT